MSEQHGYTSRLVHALPEGGTNVRNDLLTHTWERLRRLASKMLRGYPKVARREEADDIIQVAAIHLLESLKSSPPVSSLHYHNRSAQAIRRELIGLARKHGGPQGAGANHHTDHAGRAPDDAGGPLHAIPDDRSDPSTLEEWTLFHEEVARLPEEEQTVFALVYYEGKSREEIAALLDVSVRTVKRRFRSAKTLLSRAMRDHGARMQ